MMAAVILLACALDKQPCYEVRRFDSAALCEEIKDVLMESRPALAVKQPLHCEILL